MSAPLHSPAPFTVPNKGSPARLIDATGETIALVYLTDLETRKRGAIHAGNLALFLAAPVLAEALRSAEAFIAGFEDDPLQDGINERLASIRAALALLDPGA